MALFEFKLTDNQFRQLLSEHRQTQETERQRHAAIIARLDAIHAIIIKQSADVELVQAARAAKVVIDETVTALDKFTPESSG